MFKKLIILSVFALAVLTAVAVSAQEGGNRVEYTIDGNHAIHVCFDTKTTLSGTTTKDNGILGNYYGKSINAEQILILQPTQHNMPVVFDKNIKDRVTIQNAQFTQADAGVVETVMPTLISTFILPGKDLQQPFVDVVVNNDHVACSQGPTSYKIFSFLPNGATIPVQFTPIASVEAVDDEVNNAVADNGGGCSLVSGTAAQFSVIHGLSLLLPMFLMGLRRTISRRLGQ